MKVASAVHKLKVLCGLTDTVTLRQYSITTAVMIITT